MVKAHILRKRLILFMKGSGSTIKEMEMEYTNFQIHSFMKGVSKTLKNQVKVSNSSQMATFILENIRMGNLKVKANIFGLMDQFILAPLLEEKEKVLESGCLISKKEIIILVTIRKIRNKAKGSMYGQKGAFLRVSSNRI